MTEKGPRYTPRGADRPNRSLAGPISGMGRVPRVSPSPFLPSLLTGQVIPREPGTEARPPVVKSSTAKLPLEWPTQYHLAQRGWCLYPGGRVVLAFPQTPARSRARLNAWGREALCRLSLFQEGGLICKFLPVVKLTFAPPKPLIFLQRRGGRIAT